MTRLVWGVDRAPGSPRVDPSLSPDRRRTLARNAMLAQGFHPTTRRALLEPVGEHQCNDCEFCYANAGHAKTYYKCRKVAHTGGPATDTRLSWPACVLFEDRSE